MQKDASAFPSKLSIVIPVFSEVTYVTELLERVWKAALPDGLHKEIIIVESNSKDGSREQCQKFIASHPADSRRSAQLILQDQARGKGNAVREGFKYATGDIVLIQDADLEYDVNDYSSLVEPILNGKTGFVLGSRHLSSGGWKIRKFEQSPVKAALLNFGGLFFHGLFNVLFGTKLTDPTTMYKVFRRSFLKEFSLTANRFDFDYELLGKLIRTGHIPLEVPVIYKSRSFAEGKKIRIFRDPLGWILILFRARFGRI